MWSRNASTMVSKDEFNSQLNKAFGAGNKNADFKACFRGDCVDGWVPVPHKPDEKYVKVHRCQCFKAYKERVSLC